VQKKTRRPKSRARRTKRQGPSCRRLPRGQPWECKANSHYLGAMTDGEVCGRGLGGSRVRGDNKLRIKRGHFRIPRGGEAEDRRARQWTPVRGTAPGLGTASDVEGGRGKGWAATGD